MSGPTSAELPEPVAVLVSLGSNVEPEVNLPRAVELLTRRLPVLAVSRVYRTAPVGAPGPPFLNAAVLVSTRLPPARLKLEVLRPVEARLGRRRTADRNAPRTIDLDIALYDDLILEDRLVGVTLPDPDLATCAHVALPLADVAPQVRDPVSGRTLGEIAATFRGSPGIRPEPGCVLVPGRP